MADRKITSPRQFGLVKSSEEGGGLKVMGRLFFLNATYIGIVKPVCVPSCRIIRLGPFPVHASVVWRDIGERDGKAMIRRMFFLHSDYTDQPEDDNGDSVVSPNLSSYIFNDLK